MAKVITFSRVFPTTHPKKGEPTRFVEKIWKSFLEIGFSEPVWFFDEFKGLSDVVGGKIMNTVSPKHHTIRSGSRFKVGDHFSPRVWSGKPYQSKQIIIAPDIKIVKVWTFKMDEEGVFYIDDQNFDVTSSDLPENDGLSTDDFLDWFGVHPKKKYNEFVGQIICWNPTIEY